MSIRLPLRTLLEYARRIRVTQDKLDGGVETLLTMTEPELGSRPQFEIMSFRGTQVLGVLLQHRSDAESLQPD